MLERTNWVMVYVAPRGVGRTAWNADEKKQTQIRRRFMLLGQTLDGAQHRRLVEEYLADLEKPGSGTSLN